ncbi:hypothetical protein [Desulfosarcina sp.]|uniref:hypothetical protein n=1 Tax=Desulfosarcina sp. TaxID=2027861 RepID=UPI0029AB6CC5|nr:hypothetical protein [Desulfosarcina sp.]MDX2455840.1 hypothetical protein [Desulfosarcina sp.]MDX2493302.1 hypothetical protein [Desulfosarcina sp.]
MGQSVDTLLLPPATEAILDALFPDTTPHAAPGSLTPLIGVPSNLFRPRGQSGTRSIGYRWPNNNRIRLVKTEVPGSRWFQREKGVDK